MKAMRAVSIAMTLGLTLAGPAAAQEADPDNGPTAAIRPEDLALTCAQLADEAANLSQAMADDAEGGGVISSVAGVARSGASMLVPGAGLVMAGADAVTRPGREREAAAELSAQNRWHYLNGLAAGRGCGGHAEVSAPATAPATSPIAIPVERLPATPAVTTPH
jgi:hypothetical protein